MIAAPADPEFEARRVVEGLALALQASLLTRYAPPAVADAFCAARLGDGGRVVRHAARRAPTPAPILERAPRRVTTLTYETGDRIARITLDRPERGNGITLAMPGELADCVERANLDPAVHVIALAGNGKGFCGGYDLVESAEGRGGGAGGPGSPLDPATIAANHDPERPWDPVVDWQMMSRNLRGFMSLFHSDKPVVCKVHGFCVAGGTDMALCSDLLVIAADARIGYPPARAWGVPTSALWAARVGDQRAKRLLFTGDLIDGRTRARVGAGDRGAAGLRARRALRGAARADRADAGEPAGDDEAAGQPGAVRAGPARHPDPRRVLRRHRPPHPGGLWRSSAAPPRPAGARRCGSATSPTAASASLF